MADEAPAIVLAGLNKTFGRRKREVRAVQDLNLEIAPHQVYGFLGPNGAGKTTTIRMMTGLIRPTSGRVMLFGRDVQQDHAVVTQRVGALVEHAALYDFVTARQNLEILARTNGCYDPDEVQRLLERVGMVDRADRRVKGYSTGMRQRLGIAAALIGNPDLVILDEPTNGLDPAGILEMRRFIRDLVEVDGKTVFLSSHLLGEVEQVCDRVAIVSRGRIVREGSVHALLQAEGLLRVEAAPLEQAVALLQPRWSVTPNSHWVEVRAGRDAGPEVVRTLVAGGVDVFQVQVAQQSLEAYFLSVTGGAGEDEHVA